MSGSAHKTENSRQEQTIAQNKKPTKEKKQQELSKCLNRFILKATNQRKFTVSEYLSPREKLKQSKRKVEVLVYDTGG